MPKDKYKAVWVSHSSIGDFLKCPRLYYLHNVYKNPQTRHKVNIVSPPLALGQMVHSVLESLAEHKAEDRFKASLVDLYNSQWDEVSGKKGGFTSDEEEREYKKRGEAMLKQVMEHPGPLLNKAIKIGQDLPYYWISEEDNIILCGKIDWLEYLEEDDSVHILDFKTGKTKEKEDSLQLPIYHLLVANCQKRDVHKVSYWYIEAEEKPVEMELPNLEEARERVLDVAKKIQQEREEGEFKCPHGGCYACTPFETIIKGEAEFVGVGAYNQDIFVVK